MAVPRQLDEAVARLERAALDVEAARTHAASVRSLHAWLEALTAYTMALADVQRFADESVQERLHAVAARLGVREPLGPEAWPPE